MKKPEKLNEYKSEGGVGRIFKATQYSFQGLVAAFRHEAAFRQELLLAVVLLIASLFVSKSLIQWVLLFSTITAVLTVELLNSAIEALADAISTEYHPLVGRAKDLGSAAVFVSLIYTAAVWICILVYNFVL